MRLVKWQVSEPLAAFIKALPIILLRMHAIPRPFVAKSKLPAPRGSEPSEPHIIIIAPHPST